ncbi:excalibur calcium-binding domain-containing protein [Lentzea sp. BCCO 10_0856]|uniref:Excalibur calcium-binding domain-containing protein n=1 Tax=Lentzea miocenica TaxID=3095431 RepID=A0ABU4T991_9PSEU|nr:excalibur calcium-binding domain-containing protein [Lentzea sp. BCCO 10_0856]MDX8034742.1 excalibur calcium-binding domain-containing protein [Lentzea sp. BCCO 10_0856]
MSLLMVSAISACGTEAPTRLAASASSTATTTTTTTTTTPPPVTVASIVDGRTVILSNGTKVLLSGLAQPGACWAAASVEFATKTLVGKAVKVAGAQLLLADGQNYAVLAVGQGVARAVAGADAAISLAEATAKQASLGFWGPSCGGLDVKPVPVVPQPQPVVPQPQPQPEPAPAPPAPAPAYYANCAAAKAAGAAPLYRGQPGYRSALDRDNDGVACE